MEPKIARMRMTMVMFLREEEIGTDVFARESSTWISWITLAVLVSAENLCAEIRFLRCLRDSSGKEMPDRSPLSLLDVSVFFNFALAIFFTLSNTHENTSLSVFLI